MNESSDIKGLRVIKRLVGTKSLEISRAEVKFPMYCLFTNEPVEHLTEMTIHASRRGIGNDKFVTIELPLSEKWLQRRVWMKGLIRKITLNVGVVFITLAVISGFVPNSLLGPVPRPAAVGILAGFGLVGTIVGLMWPQLLGAEADAYALPGVIKKDFLILGPPFAHKDFLARIPEE